MPWFTGFVVFVLIWWVVFFAVLPFGTRPVDVEIEAGGWRGVPERPMLGRKLLITTVISAVLCAGAITVIRSDWLSFRHGWLAMHSDGAD
jgi:predicted secreted protein